jgi:hypothetical protein
MRHLKYLLSLVVIVWALVAAQHAIASEVSLVWNTVSNADGYKVYCGIVSREYAPEADVGSLTTHTIELDDGQLYYFAVTAYNVWGESLFSKEVSAYLVPEGDREAPIPPQLQPGCNVIYIVPSGTVTIKITVLSP